MRIDAGRFTVRLAETDAEICAAQRLRYRVFVEEMGASVNPEDEALKRESDQFDPYFDHMILIDNDVKDDPDTLGVVGVYRLLRGTRAKEGIGFYGSTEYDLTLLANHRLETLELGRSCIDAAYRGGAGMHLLWNGLGSYVALHNVSILFGVASFHGNDPRDIAQALSYLHYNHLAPPDLRVRVNDADFQRMDLLPPDEVDRVEALRQIPALIKAYIRLGGFVGEGAYIDRDFNTIDVCLLMDTSRMVQRYRNFYSRNRSGAAEEASE